LNGPAERHDALLGETAARLRGRRSYPQEVRTMSAADLPLPPPLCPGNPGQGTEGTVGFATAHKNWEETFDLLALLAEVLRAGGYQVKQEAAWLLLPDSGYILQPQ
jgi:hypothetical protein